MSTTEEVSGFFESMGSGSPNPRQKFCGVFCPVEGSAENKTLDFDSLSMGRAGGKTDKRVIDKQRDISQPAARKIEIRRSTGKEALQNLNEEDVQVKSKTLASTGLLHHDLPRYPKDTP